MKDVEADTTADEVAELVARADHALNDLVSEYEPVEERYRAATGALEPVFTVATTATVPRAYTVATTSLA